MNRAPRSLPSAIGHPLLSLAAPLILLLSLAGTSFGQEVTPDMYDGLRWRHIGPPGNRASAVVGVPGDPMVSFIGAASGGVWKTTDGGINWYPTFDDMEAQSIGAMAIAPSDPNIVWVGTGEVVGTEQHLHRERRLQIHRWRGELEAHGPRSHRADRPGGHRSPGSGHRPCGCRRAFLRTPDRSGESSGPPTGERRWEQTLFIDENTGVFEIAMDPSNPRILLAGAWPLVIRTYGRESGGPNGGIYRSTDSGATWEKTPRSRAAR